MQTGSPNQADTSPGNAKVMKGATQLFDVVKIVDVTLVDCRAFLRPGVDGPLRLAIRKKAHAKRSPSRDGLCAQINFVLEGRVGEEGESDIALSIEATYNAVYEIPADHDANQDALDLFAHTNGTFNLWPYWREFVQTTSARMGLAGLTVPTYRIEEVFTGPGIVDRAVLRAENDAGDI